MSEPVIVIGAGPAGLSCAYSLVEKGQRVVVFEASPHVGGMARSFDLWGHRVDLGPHRFFSKQKEIHDFFITLIRDDYDMVDRQTRIYYNNSFFDYPLKLSNVLKNLPVGTIIKIIWYYVIQQIRPIRNPQNFEEWVTNRFGKQLFEIFFKHYTEKLWGIPCTKIDADWAAQRIKTLTLWAAVKSALVGNRGNKHKTLVDQFAYPRRGTGTIYENAAESVEEHGSEVRMSCPIKRVLLNEANEVTGIETVSGEVVNTNQVVSTMPITLLLKGLPNVPANVLEAADKLYFRNTLLVYLEIDRKNLFTDNWLYVHSPDVKHGRVTNFSNWKIAQNGLQNSTVLCLEYWCFDDDELWTGDEEVVKKLACEEIFTVDLIPQEANILNTEVVKVPRCYPVYETGYQQYMEVVIDYLKQIKGLHPIGRYGAFKYNNQDHSLLMGILAAEKIASGKEVDLWSINTDTEYQEEGRIKDILHQ